MREHVVQVRGEGVVVVREHVVQVRGEGGWGEGARCAGERRGGGGACVVTPAPRLACCPPHPLTRLTPHPSPCDQAQYFKDPDHLDWYLAHSGFLADVRGGWLAGWLASTRGGLPAPRTWFACVGACLSQHARGGGRP